MTSPTPVQARALDAESLEAAAQAGMDRFVAALCARLNECPIPTQIGVTRLMMIADDVRRALAATPMPVWRDMASAPKEPGNCYLVTNKLREVASCEVQSDGARLIHSSHSQPWTWGQKATGWQAYPKPPAAERDGGGL